MIESILCALLPAWAVSLAAFVWASNRAIARGLAPIRESPGSKVAVIVPVTGKSSTMQRSIGSLLSRTDPCRQVVFAVEDSNDPAAAFVQEAIRGKEAAQCVFAGPAIDCGQKNHNLLAGVAAVSGRPDVLVFADGGHDFPDGWLERLVAPIVRDEAKVTSGYHAVTPSGYEFISWIYAVCVQMMLVFQNAPGLGQPWGGAMAISRELFEQLKIANAWRISVVDDVSLAHLLKAHGMKVRTLPQVCRQTPVGRLSLREFFEWLVRQLQYVRFIFPGTWAALGIWSFLQVLVFCLSPILILSSAAGLTTALCGGAAVFYLGIVALVLLQIRLLHPSPCTSARWLAAGAVLIPVFGAALAEAGFRREIKWRGITYRVGRQGRVLAVHR